MKRPRWVLDTNVLVAALRSRSGASFALLKHLRARSFIHLVSVSMLLELEAVLKRPDQLRETRLTVDDVDIFLDAIGLLSEPVHIHYVWRPQTRDPADDMVLETALSGSADALVTFNVRDFAAAGNFKLQVLRPAAALALFQAGD